MKVRIWDFAGHTVTHAVHQFFLSERCLYILVYDARTDDRSRLYYWLDHMKNYGGDSEAIILVNERDEHKAQIPEDILKSKYAIHSVHYFNLKEEPTKLAAFRALVSHTIINNPCWNNQVIPKDFYQVKADLEDKFQTHEQITLDEFKTIANKHQINEHNQLLQHLNALGIGLWYPKLAEFNTLVLNPEWLSHGVYKIINCVANKRAYKVELDDFGDIFTGNDMTRFSVALYPFLFRLISHYQLAYQTQDSEVLVIPHLLPEDQPDSLPVFNVEESLELKYMAEHPLPPHTISRFIVEHNQILQIKENKPVAWRTGAIIEVTNTEVIGEDNDSTIALAQEDDRNIIINAKGPYKTELINELRNTLDKIFASYKSDKPELLYRVIESGEFSVQEMHGKPTSSWVRNKEINLLSQAGSKYHDNERCLEIDLHETIKRYGIQLPFKPLAEKEKDGSDIKTLISNLQSNFNELAEELDGAGEQEPAKALATTANMLSKVTENTKQLDHSAALKRVKRIMKDIDNQNSRLSLAIKNSYYGKDILEEIKQDYQRLSDLL